MYLKKWKPVFVKVLGAMHGDISLCFKAELQCPLCQTLNAVITSGHVVNSRDFDRTVNNKIDELAQHRGCTNCGAVSTFPKFDLEKLRHEAKQITSKVIQAESDLLHNRKS